MNSRKWGVEWGMLDVGREVVFILVEDVGILVLILQEKKIS